MYKYFVLYSMESNGCWGFGCCEVHLKSKITDFEDLKLVKESIEQGASLKKVTILNYQLMSEPNQKGT